MQEVYIVAIGQIPVAKKSPLSIKKMAIEALKPAFEQVDPQQITALYVGNMLSAQIAQQQQLGALIANCSGLHGVEALTIETACSSGAAALHQGVMAIASGMHDCVAVCGVEKMHNENISEPVSKFLAYASDWEKEGATGETFVSLNALLMRNYLERYRIPRTLFGSFPLIAHHNAMMNPFALFHKAVTPPIYEASEMICDPLRLYDICPVCDGAAALILGSKAFLESRIHQTPLVRIRASSIATDFVGLHAREMLYHLKSVALSTGRALTQAKMGLQDIDLFELHDAYSITSALSLESAGFAKPGEALMMAADGEFGLQGKLPIATFGGLKARGHPIGASGVYQAVEMTLQLTQQAQQNQVPGVSVGMIQGIGGCGSVTVTHILEAV